MRLATFNILSGRSPADDRVDPDRFADSVRDLDADVLALQEVDRGQARSGYADLTELAAEAMGTVDHRFVPALTGTPGKTWSVATGDEPVSTAAYGVSLLSRYPVSGWRVLRLPALPGPAPYRFAGQRTPHLVADEPRVAVVADIASPFGLVTVACTHLSFLPGWNVVQLRPVIRAVRDCPQLALLGDLNIGPAVARRVTGLRPAATAPTFPSWAPTRQIDHLLVRGLPAPRRALARATPVSDHCVLLADW
jgi:endonuclease/exonuclease/phosphatase family metal-dependent hydrolase